MSRPICNLGHHMIEDHATSEHLAADPGSIRPRDGEFSGFFEWSPDQLTFEKVRSYQLHLISRGLQAQTVNRINCGCGVSTPHAA
jgi:hypothetical protein